MARELYKISPFVSKRPGATLTVEEMNHVITEVNKGFAEMAKQFGLVNGRDGATPKFFNDLDLDGHSIKSVKSIQFGVRPHATNETAFTGKFDVDEPAAAPATATALRDDLTDNVLPDIREALQIIGTLLVKILSVVRV